MHETIRMLGREKERELLAEAERLHRGAIAKRDGGRHVRALRSFGAVRRALAARTGSRWPPRLWPPRRTRRASDELGPR